MATTAHSDWRHCKNQCQHYFGAEHQRLISRSCSQFLAVRAVIYVLELLTHSIYLFASTSGKNRPLVTSQPVEIQNSLIEFKIFGK